MLKPAILYKTEIEQKFAEVMYSDEYFLYTGYAYEHELPKVEPQDNVYQWAIVNENPKNDLLDDYGYFHKRVLGWFAYRIDPANDNVFNFGLYSFDKGNPIIGKDVFTKMEELVLAHRRIEWRVIGGNPVIRHYDKFCERFSGNKITFHSTIKAPDGTYRDEHVYEIVRDI